MIVDTFIRRPILASVCSLVIILAGAMSIPTLSIAQFPELAPPAVTVNAFYQGASAQVVETAVTQPIEQAINGVEGMQYMTSSSGSNGSSTVTVTFDVNRSIDIAAVDVQNRVSGVEGRLPNEVKQVGISVTKSGQNFVLAAGVYADKNQYDPLFISNYLDRFVRDELQRVPGVGSIVIFGERKYAMRLWLDPDRLAGRGITAGEVVNALREQNVQVAAGEVGAQPSRPGQTYQISVRAVGRLAEMREFDDIILKRTPDGTLVRLKDVGRTELGAENYTTDLRYGGRDAVGIGVTQLPTANALQVFRDVSSALDRLSQSFPPGLKVEVAFDTTRVVSESINEVVTTLLEAIALVILVMFLFLQNWRTTLIPAITIPVSLIGTFAFIKLFGFSINTLTLFGITLATGLVVDDAIVVIENIERHIHESHQSPRDAASAAMGEVTGAVIATALVLGAVFVPVAFFPGTTGRLYQQFALTIAFSMAISAFNALTLTPALAGILLAKTEKPKGAFFRGVNRVIDGGTAATVGALRRLIRVRALVALVFVALLGATYWVYNHVPTGFAPDEDQGYIFILIQAPQGASLDYTMGIEKQVEQVVAKMPQIQHVFGVGGFSFAGSGPNQGILFCMLKDFSEREGPANSAKAVVGQLFGMFSEIPGAMVIPFLPPSVPGLGNFGGFQYELLDQTGGPIEDLANAARNLSGQANQTPGLAGVFTQFTADDPQLVVTIDREQAKSLGINLGDITQTMQILLGSSYVNDFDFNNRSYRVYVQADSQFRSNPSDIERYSVRNSAGQMMPLSNVVSIREGTAPQNITHYNLFRSVTIDGSAAPGFSSGQALTAMTQLSGTALPQGMTFAWSGLSREEILAGSQAATIFALGLLLVYLTLAAQYESLTLPFIILLSVPLAILGALLAQWGRGLINDVYCQIGLVMLIGLSAKNGILIVEFAEQLRHRGMSIAEAAVEAARIRLRPILMTSLAFILGVMPLVFANGAGQEARHSVGTAVAGGMIASTFLNLAFIPILYVVVKSLTSGGVTMHRDTITAALAETAELLTTQPPGALQPRRARRHEGLFVQRLSCLRDLCGLVVTVALALIGGSVAFAQQPPVPAERVTFQQAIDRAVVNNPSAAVAAAGILRADALLRQAKAATLVQVNGSVQTTTLNTSVDFDGTTVTPRSQVSASLTVDMPIVAAAAWARRAQARDNQNVAELSAAETRRQIALSTADAYLSILGLRRVVEGNVQAVVTGRAHFDLATQLEQQGTGSRLNALRAEQQLSTFQRNLEVTTFAVYRAQEALGVLLVANGPVDAVDEPDFALPPDAAALAAQPGDITPSLLQSRPDLRLFSGQQLAAARVLRDSSKDRWPSLDALFVPQSVRPAQFFSSPDGWRFLLQAGIPISDSGTRSALKTQRQSAFDISQANLTGALIQASSEVRLAREAVASAARALTSAQAAADQARQVVNIVNVSFRAGGATNIEVIDADRSSRDADTAVAIAEDLLRRARLDLLLALGRFP